MKIFTLTQKLIYNYPKHPTSIRRLHPKSIHKFPPLVTQMALISMRTVEAVIQCLYFSHGWLHHKTRFSDWNHRNPNSVPVSVQYTSICKIYLDHFYNTLRGSYCSTCSRVDVNNESNKMWYVEDCYKKKVKYVHNFPNKFHVIVNSISFIVCPWTWQLSRLLSADAGFPYDITALLRDMIKDIFSRSNCIAFKEIHNCWSVPILVPSFQ
jgi:hypothetical protein